MEIRNHGAASETAAGKSRIALADPGKKRVDPNAVDPKKVIPLDDKDFQDF
jgi:hypothetical protein